MQPHPSAPPPRALAATSSPSRHPRRLGDWQVEPELLRLFRGDEVVHLEPRVMEVLLRLLERPREVISKRELLEGVWRDTAVSEVALPRCISDLRRALGDEARNPSYIETIPTRGYRLIASVDPPLPPSVALVESSPSQPPQRSRRPRRAIAVAVVVALVALLAVSLWYRADGGGRQATTSIAVLPLRDLSAAPGDHFSRSLSDLLANRLAQRSDLRVVAIRRGDLIGASAVELAESLGVDQVLEGAILRQGDTVRLTLQLVDGRSGEYLWAATRVATGDDVVAMQEAMVDGVAFSLATEQFGVEGGTPGANAS